MDYGITIAMGTSPFTLTSVVTIVPRYILVNKLPFSIRVGQSGHKDRVLLKPSEKLCYNFKKSTKPADKKLVIGDIPYPELDEELPFSYPFCLEDIGDFQVSYKCFTGKDKGSPQWYEPSARNKYMRSVHVSVASQDDASLFIVFQAPAMPEYTITNSTLDAVKVLSKGAKEDLLKVESGETKVLLWLDPAASQKEVVLVVGEHKGTYDITSIGKQKTIKGGKDIFYHVGITAKNYGREITVNESSSREKSAALTERQAEEMKSATPKSGKLNKAETIESSLDIDSENDWVKLDDTHSKDDIKIKALLAGVGVSIIDSEPKELIFVSVHGIDVLLEKKAMATETVYDTHYFSSVNVNHIQIDNMLNKSFPVIFSPATPLRSAKDGDWSPFIQTQVSLSETCEGKLKFTRCNSFQLQLNEMLVFIDLEILTEVLKVVGTIVESLHPAAQPKHESKLQYYSPETVFKQLDPELSEEPPVKIGENKVFIELLNLAAMKLRLTLRLGKISIDPTGNLAILEVLYPILASVSNISDAPLYFTEIIMKNTYAPLSSLIKSLQKNYTHQAILRFYYLLGSMDIIGNPIGLLDRLGSGVFEFFNEPRKGMLKGPKEFAEGLNKGFKSLVTNVVGGGLNSVSRVTGSLYTLFK